MNPNSVVKLYANCIPVKGARRSLICDLHYRTYEFIPNALYDILTQYKNKSIAYIKQQYTEQYHGIIDEYFVFILNQNLGFECDEEEIE